MTWHLEVDGKECIASGMCAALAPGHFELTGPHARPITADVPPEDLLLDAADSCPVLAITVTAPTGVVAPRD